MSAPKPIQLIFQLEQETKNKIRFQEMDAAKDGKPASPTVKDNAVVEKLYISKKTLKKMGDPDVLHVTIAAP